MGKKNKNLSHAAFVICVAVLAIAAAGMDYTMNKFGVVLKKTPIELRKKLDLIDKPALIPYEIKSESKIELQDVADSLGTEDYIQWTLEDTSADPLSPTRFCFLFITYYNLPDKVPHVPEECYVGGGNTQVSSKGVTLSLKGADPINNKTLEVDARFLMFKNKENAIWQTDAVYPIMYFFRVNDEYANSRFDVMEVLGRNLLGKHSYFSKVEWRFFGNRYGNRIVPDEKQTIEAGAKLMSRLVPVLLQDHWPNLDSEKNE